MSELANTKVQPAYLSAIAQRNYKEVFPQLNREIDGRSLVYLDNAATTLKPQCVIDAVVDYYSNHCANVHRGAHVLSEEATALYEKSRDQVRSFLSASDRKEIVFTSGTTDAINLVASSFGAKLKKGDEIILSYMEHHSNFVPWQMLAKNKGVVLQVVNVDEKGDLDLADYEKKLSKKTKLVTIVHTSNTLGTVNPVKKIIELAHGKGAKVFIDAAQAMSHAPLNVVELDCDFLTFSSHKIFGPTGVGVLYGKYDLLEEMQPYRSGGDMIVSVSLEETLYKSPPHRFEAGTPAIAQVIGLGAALSFVKSVGFDFISQNEKKLLEYASKRLSLIKPLKIIGTSSKKVPIFSFVIKDIHPHDIGTVLSGEGVAIRAGHHCTELLMRHYNLVATSRAAFSFYNTQDDVDRLVDAIEKCLHTFT